MNNKESNYETKTWRISDFKLDSQAISDGANKVSIMPLSIKKLYKYFKLTTARAIHW